MTETRPPRRGEVALWSLLPDEASPARIAAWHAALSTEERARADRFHFAADRAAYVSAHALLRALLAAHGVPAPRFVLGSWGRPELEGPDGVLRFSLTHTRGLVAAGVAAADDLGVDAEAARPEVDALGLAARFFAPAEAARLRALPEARRADAFCRLWTLKEAFVKATGRGLSLPLDRFAFGLDPLSFICDAALGDPAEWAFQAVAMGEGAHLAVALRAPRLTLHHAPLDPPALDRALAACPAP